MPSFLASARPLFLTLTAGAVGGTLFSQLSLPLPWILGAIFGVVVASRTPLPLARPPRGLLTPARMVLGLAIGATFNRSILDHLATYGASLLFLAPYLAVVALAGSWYFRRFVGLDRPTAFLSALPGGLAELLVLSDDVRADVRRVALVQGTRILALVYILPFVAGALADQPLGGRGAIATPLVDSAPGDLALLVVLALAGWRLLALIRLSGAPIVGPMLAAAAAMLTGVLHQGPPDEVFKIAQWLLGSSVGAVFIGSGGRALLRTFVSSLGYLLILTVVTAVTAITVHEVAGAPLVPALLAFAPGGQAEMSLIAILLHEDPAYVALHHLVRLILIVTLLPPLARRMFAVRSGRDRSTRPPAP